MPIDLLPATGFSELIGDPFGRWVRGHPKPQDLPSAMAHDQQTIEQSERDCRHDEEVHCDNAIRMVAKERLPSLRGFFMATPWVAPPYLITALLRATPLARFS